ncbi:MAG TPA: hypothetical protein VKU41_22640 [Polyangiaceae bacterium]|nr:hypothetical protein [Polyangiaceae bacterium]
MSPDPSAAVAPLERVRQLALASCPPHAAPPPPDARAVLDVWFGLVEGRLEFVEWFETGTRRYFVVRASPADRAARAPLDGGEEALANLIGSGLSEKAACYELGIKPSVASARLKRALFKLGLRSRTDLVLLVRPINPPRPTGAPRPPDPSAPPERRRA